MAMREVVSLNQDAYEADKQINELESQGYVSIDSYGNDFDVGIIFEYSKDKDSQDVLKRHQIYTQQLENEHKLNEELGIY